MLMIFKQLAGVVMSGHSTWHYVVTFFCHLVGQQVDLQRIAVSISEGANKMVEFIGFDAVKVEVVVPCDVHLKGFKSQTFVKDFQGC